MNWQSLHLFLRKPPSPAAYDQMITTVVAPAIQFLEQNTSLDQYFFIRYGQLGPHIRFRVKLNSSDLNDRLLPWIVENYELGENQLDEFGNKTIVAKDLQ